MSEAFLFFLFLSAPSTVSAEVHFFLPLGCLHAGTQQERPVGGGGGGSARAQEWWRQTRLPGTGKGSCQGHLSKADPGQPRSASQHWKCDMGAPKLGHILPGPLSLQCSPRNEWTRVVSPSPLTSYDYTCIVCMFREHRSYNLLGH